MCVVPPQTDGLCSGDGVIIQTVNAEATSSDPLDQSQLAVETEGRGLDDRLEATSLLEGSGGVVTETQEAMTDDFTDKVQTRAGFLQLHKTHAFNLKSPLFGQFVHLFLCVCQELSSPSVEAPVVHSGITPGSAVLIVSPPNISSTLTGNGVSCRYFIHQIFIDTRTIIINHLLFVFWASAGSCLLRPLISSTVCPQIQSWRTRKVQTKPDRRL